MWCYLPCVLLCVLVDATPTAILVSARGLESPPQPTPFRIVHDATTTRLVPRGIISKIESKIENLYSSKLAELGQAIPSLLANGIPEILHHMPHGSAIESSLGLQPTQIAALPTQVLNLPPYANWTDQGWNVRFHGNVYKQPNTTKEMLNKLANKFLIGVDINQLPPNEQDQARNVTSEIFVVQQGNQSVQLNLISGNLVQEITLPYPTTGEGDFDVFQTIRTGGDIIPGNATNVVQNFSVYANGSTLGNATAYLVPPTGISVVSDIDDILRVTQIFLPKDGILNTFAKPFVPWLNMPNIYANWSKSIPGIHFHYLTTTPEQATRNYMDFIYKTYPMGSFDTRPLNFSDTKATFSIREALLRKVMETFPSRKFILMADTSNSDVMRDYPKMAKEFPDQVLCIFLRNTSATDRDYLPYNTKGFKGLSNESYMFFITPDDLTNLDVMNGKCLNSSVKQNVTFGTQDELLGIHGKNSGVRGNSSIGWMGLTVTFLVGFISLL
jgi:hypothetical protein